MGESTWCWMVTQCGSVAMWHPASRAMCCWRLRNHKEAQTLCEELSGIYDQQTWLERYRAATAEPYSFLFIRLDAKTRDTMFYLRCKQRLVPEDVGEE